MNTRKFLVLTLAAAFLSAPFAVTADAATRSHAGVTRHHVAKPIRSTGRTAARAASNADRSADSLNAQSLARARGQ